MELCAQVVRTSQILTQKAGAMAAGPGPHKALQEGHAVYVFKATDYASMCLDESLQSQNAVPLYLFAGAWHQCSCASGHDMRPVNSRCKLHVLSHNAFTGRQGCMHM